MATTEESKAEDSSSTASTSCFDPCVIGGPSGVGKGTLLRRLRDEYPGQFAVAVSHTTRGPRSGEEDGVHYNFVSKEEFESMIKKGEFLEHANVHGRLYGTSVAAVESVRAKGQVCLLEIDFQGAQRIKESDPFDSPPKFVFITCSGGFETLKSRLTGRSTETEEQIAKRLETAKLEFKFVDENPGFFDEIFTNDDLDQCFGELVGKLSEWYPQITAAKKTSDSDAKPSATEES